MSKRYDYYLEFDSIFDPPAVYVKDHYEGKTVLEIFEEPVSIISDHFSTDINDWRIGDFTWLVLAKLNEEC